MSRRKSYLRYREDVGMESRCHECLAYWPLTPEFWDMKSFVRCRACWLKYHRAKDRIRNARPEVIEKNRLYQAKYRANSKRAKQLSQQVYYWKDPEAQRQKARDYYYRNRDAILDKARQRHAARKAA